VGANVQRIGCGHEMLAGGYFQYCRIITNTQFDTAGCGNGGLPLNLSNQLEFFHKFKPV
jgi:hypothetical protein